MRKLLAFLSVLGVAACSGEAGAPPGAEDPGPLAESPAARARVAELRGRFGLGAGTVTGFVRAEGGRARPVVGAFAGRGLAKLARVELPARASGAVHLEDAASGVAVDFALEGAGDAELAVAGGLAVYPGALPGADLVHRPRAEGTEDYVVFEQPPAREELVYRVDVSRVAGLRLMSGSLELLDAAGTPRLRVAPPYVVGASGERRDARLDVEGCAVDTDPHGPWGRAVTPPGARSCAVRVRWEGVGYPAMVDPAWTTTGSLATARQLHTASLLPDGRVLVAGGESVGNTAKSVEIYDPASGTWSAGPSMLVARGQHAAAVLANGKILLAGGIDYGTVTILANAELYDPSTSAWTATPNMTSPREVQTATLLVSGKVLVAGGSSSTMLLASAELYDPAANTWTATPSMMKARSHHTASRLQNGNVLLAGGLVAGGSTAGAELYDPVANSFSPTAFMASPRSEHAAAVLANGTVLIASGWNFASMTWLKSAEIYDPVAAHWTATPTMATGRRALTASVLGSGKVLVAGGKVDISTDTAHAELYDPAANAWSAAPDLLAGRAGHAATLLQNGDVLVEAGIGANETMDLPSAELYVDQPGPNGAPCAAAAGCQSGFCADGVCCDTACGGGVAGDCQACSVAAGAVTDGTCAMLTGAVCDDGNACTQTSTCQSGVCTGANPVVCTPLDECHTAGACAPATGCSNPSKPDGAQCAGGSCQGGVCTGGTSSSSAASSSASASSSSASSSTTSSSTTSSSTTSSGTTSSSGGTGGATSTSTTSTSAGGTGGSVAATSSGAGGGALTDPYACATAPGRDPGSPVALLGLAGALGAVLRRRRGRA